MTWFLNDITSQKNRVDNLVSPIGTPEEQGIFRGSMDSVGAGIGSIFLQTDRALTAFMQPVLDPITLEADRWFGTNWTETLDKERAQSKANVIANRPIPEVTGEVGQVLYGLTSTLGKFGVGFAAGGPVGAAAFVGSTEAQTEFDVLTSKQGGSVDAETARSVALITGGAAGLGAFIPATFGLRALGDVAVSVSANVGLGVAQRYSSNQILAEQYPAVAEHYKALDGLSLAIDAGFGALAPGVARYLKHVEGKKNAEIEDNLRKIIKPEEKDALSEAERVVHEAKDLSPGLHTTIESLKAHAKTLDEASTQLAEGKHPQDVVITNPPKDMIVDPEKLANTRVIDSAVQEEIKLSTKRADDDVSIRELPESTNQVEVVRLTKQEQEYESAKETVITRKEEGKEAVETTGDKALEQIDNAKDKLKLEEISAKARLESAENAAAKKPTGATEIKVDAAKQNIIEIQKKMSALESERSDLLKQVDEQRAKIAEERSKKLDPDQYADNEHLARVGDISPFEDIGARQILDEMPDMMIKDEDGNLVSAVELMKRADEEILAAKENSKYIDIAVVCGLRNPS